MTYDGRNDGRQGTRDGADGLHANEQWPEMAVQNCNTSGAAIRDRGCEEGLPVPPIASSRMSRMMGARGRWSPVASFALPPVFHAYFANCENVPRGTKRQSKQNPLKGIRVAAHTSGAAVKGA